MTAYFKSILAEIYFIILFNILILSHCHLGPCGGKTTGQTRLCTFFENLGWKVILSDSISQNYKQLIKMS